MVNVKDVTLGKNVRKSFAKINEVLEMPNLIEVQKNSYNWFITEGLREVFRDMPVISDYNGTFELSFTGFRFDDKLKYTIAECKERDVTYYQVGSIHGRYSSDDRQRHVRYKRCGACCGIAAGAFAGRVFFVRQG